MRRGRQDGIHYPLTQYQSSHRAAGQTKHLQTELASYLGRKILFKTTQGGVTLWKGSVAIFLLDLGFVFLQPEWLLRATQKLLRPFGVKRDSEIPFA
jgi:hypothetical protein